MKKYEAIAYSRLTRTYRGMPQNHWLASVSEGGTLIFDSWDSAIKEFDFQNDVRKLHESLKSSEL